uniref:Uncharacterized protein n=1 Tax=Cannabis sativa TaxID=3483 RepID=A0A803Q2J6_CANSA
MTRPSHRKEVDSEEETKETRRAPQVVLNDTVKANEQWLEDWRKQFPASMSEVKELSIHFKDVMPNEGAWGTSTFIGLPLCLILNLDRHRLWSWRRHPLPSWILPNLPIRGASEPGSLEYFEEDSFDCDGPIKAIKKPASPSDDGTNKKVEMEAKNEVPQLTALRRQIGLMAERSYSLITQLAYDMEVVKAEHDNAKQRREEAEKALADANANMKTTTTQRVFEYMEKSLSQ